MVVVLFEFCFMRLPSVFGCREKELDHSTPSIPANSTTLKTLPTTSPVTSLPMAAVHVQLDAALTSSKTTPNINQVCLIFRCMLVSLYGSAEIICIPSCADDLFIVLTSCCFSVGTVASQHYGLIPSCQPRTNAANQYWYHELEWY